MPTQTLPSNGTSTPAAPNACPVCGSASTRVFSEFRDVPVLCNAPCASEAAAKAMPTGQIHLAFCEQCGMVFNQAFSPEAIDYTQAYENSLHYSAQFDRYIRGLAQDLVSRHGLRGKDIIEIGCGKGDFLALLAELGQNRCVGFDRSYEPDRLAGTPGQLEIIPDFYQESYSHLPCDLLACRHVLEHIHTPVEFLQTLRRTIGSRPQTVTFFEVPNALYTLRHRGIWDIIYEHVSYFWPLPLRYLFTRCGFEVQSVSEAYSGQFLCIEARPSEHGAAAPEDPEGLAQVAEEVRQFVNVFDATMGAAGQVLDDLERRNARAVIWGSGSKGVTFLNLFRDRESLTHAVDINPHKHGKFIAGTGHPIVAPKELVRTRPDVVFVMNPLYRGEIAQNLAALGVRAELVNV